MLLMLKTNIIFLLIKWQIIFTVGIQNLVMTSRRKRNDLCSDRLLF